jgi:Rha family phage regulatory protein
MQLVINYKNQVSTTSVLVAEKFNKRHDDVLKAIRNVDCSDEFRARNFAASSYKSLQNRDLPMFIITRDGFTLLMMSFTGGKAATFREEYINEFNRMEKLLRTQTPILLPTYQNRMLSEPTLSVPRGYWSVFDRAHSIMLLIEKHVGSVSQYDLVDGSIGIKWAAFRKTQSWVLPSAQYAHEYNDKRGTQMCNCYQNAEAVYFDDWLKYVYKPNHLFDYLNNKYRREKNVFMLAKIAKVMPRLLRAS